MQIIVSFDESGLSRTSNGRMASDWLEPEYFISASMLSTVPLTLSCSSPLQLSVIVFTYSFYFYQSVVERAWNIFMEFAYFHSFHWTPWTQVDHHYLVNNNTARRMSYTEAISMNAIFEHLHVHVMCSNFLECHRTSRSTTISNSLFLLRDT